MEIQLLTQPILNNGEHFSLGEKITSILESKKPKCKTANFIFGVIKQSAIDYLTPHFKDFIANNGVINFYIDSDKRATSKNIVNELISIGCNVFVFSSENSLTEFQYRGCFFETSKKVEVFLTSGNLSLNGLFDSFNIVTHLTYNIESKDNNEFLEFKETVLNDNFLSNFRKVEHSEEIYDEDNWNLVKPSVLPIPSINEFTHKSDTATVSNNVDDDLGIMIEIDDNVDFLTPVETPKEPKKIIEKVAISEPVEKKIDTSDIIEYPTETILVFKIDKLRDVVGKKFEKSENLFLRKCIIKCRNIHHDLI